MKKVGKNYYYFQTKYGYMMKYVRYMNSNDVVYYFGGDGIMVKSVFYTWSGNNEKHTYYFMSDGKMCRSWLTLNGKKYYFDPDTMELCIEICTLKIKRQELLLAIPKVYAQRNKNSSKKGSVIRNCHFFCLSWKIMKV